MDKIELNLGPFNKCVDDVSQVQKIEYPVSFYLDEALDKCKRVFYYSMDATVKSQNVSETFVVPMFELNMVSNLQNRIKPVFEVMIIQRICQLIEHMDIPFCLDQLVIPTTELKIHCGEDNKSYGFMKVGMAIFAE